MNYNTENKSNTSTFTGKAARYNKMFLEALLYGEKNTMDVAIYIKNKEREHAKIRHQKTISSTLTRRGGARERLQEKRYIAKNSETGKWCLTTKGLLVALSFQEDLDAVYPMLKGYIDAEGANLEKLFKSLGTFFSPEYAKDIGNLAHSKGFFELLGKETCKLIEKGVDIDEMSENELYDLVTLRAYRPVVMKLFEKHLNRKQAELAPKVRSLLSDFEAWSD
jgi:hypothetical protein